MRLIALVIVAADQTLLHPSNGGRKRAALDATYAKGTCSIVGLLLCRVDTFPVGGGTLMSRTARIRFWIEAALALLTAGLLVFTLISREWIELLFGVDPDGGDGSLEWAIVAVLLVATVTFTWLACVEWRGASSQEQ
jgi:hypothetical protein